MDKWFLLPVLFTTIFGLSHGLKTAEIKFTDLQFTCDEKFLIMNASVANNKSIDVDLETLYLLDNYHISLQIILLEFVGKRNVVLLNRTVDVCDNNTEAAREPLWRIINHSLEKTGNLSLVCPFQKGVFFVRNFTLIDYQIPNYVPMAKFKAVFSAFEEDVFGDLKKIVHIVVFGQVDSPKSAKIG